MPKGVADRRQDILNLKEEEAVKLILDDYERSKRWRDVVNERNRRYRDMYFQKDRVPAVTKGKDPKAETDKRSHIYIGLARAIVDTAISLLVRAMFPQEKFISIEPTEAEDEEHSAAFEDLFYYRTGRGQMNLKYEFKDNFLFQLALYDFAVARVGWLIKRAYVPHISLGQRLIKLAHWVYPWTAKNPNVSLIPKDDAIDRPDFEVLDTLKCYPDPKATDFADSRYFIYLRDTNIGALRKREKTKKNPFGVYQNLDNVAQTPYPGKEAQQKTEEMDKDEHGRDHEEDLVEEMYYHTPDGMVVVGNRKHIMRKRTMAGYPFTKGTYCPVNHQWGGIGIVEGIEQLQHQLNQDVRLRLDNRNAIINAIAIINKRLFPDHVFKDFKMHPGRTLLTTAADASKAIHFPRPPDLTQTIQNDINFEIHMAERITGVSENAQAIVKAGGRRTATEMGLIAQGMETRLGEVAAAVEEKNLVDIVYLDYNQEQLNLTEEVKFRILGPKGFAFRTIAKKDILHKGAFDVRPLGSRFEANKAMRTNQFLQGIQISAQIPPMAQRTDWGELQKELWTQLGQKNPERFILDDSRTDYRIPPQIENELLASGHEIEVGNYDNDEEHITAHTWGMENGNYPPENRFAFEQHILKHQQRMAQAEQMGRRVQLPQTESGAMGQPYQIYGGPRVPAGGRPAEGGAAYPQAPAQTGAPFQGE